MRKRAVNRKLTLSGEAATELIELKLVAADVFTAMILFIMTARFRMRLHAAVAFATKDMYKLSYTERYSKMYFPVMPKPRD